MIKEIQIEVSEAIGQAFDYCIKYHHDDFVLFLAHPELKKDWLELGKQIVLMDSAIDLLKDESRENFYVRYLRRNYRKDGFFYNGEDGIDDLHIELMIYTHIWESTYFFKQLFRLVGVVLGNGYVWEINTTRSKHKEIKETMIPALREKNLLLCDLLNSAYSSYLRDSFAHSEYAIDVNAKKIHLFNASRNKADKDDNIISFATFQQKFMKSIQLCYWLNHYIEMARLDYAKASVVTNPILIPDGRKMQVLAKIVGKEENMRARFDGIIIK